MAAIGYPIIAASIRVVVAAGTGGRPDDDMR
jgi:hypothetical protein